MPLPIIPFIPTASIPILSIPSLSYAINLGTLFYLSQPIHPVASVIFGTLSGMLWNSNITTFLAEPYWSNGVILMYIAFSVFSLKASDSPLVPFFDFVSWGDIQGWERRKKPYIVGV